MIANRRRMAVPIQENGRLPTWLFVGMAAFVMAAAGSRVVGLWQAPSLIDLVRRPIAAQGRPTPGHGGEPSKPLDTRWRVAPSAPVVDPVPGRWARPLEPAAQPPGPRAP